MLVYYDAESGVPLYTLKALDGFVPPAGTFIEAEDADLELHQWRVEDGELVPLDALMLTEARDRGITTINRVSGQIRSRFITVIPGQEMLYLLKEREAVDWLAASAPDPVDFPLISAEIGITGGPDADAHVVAQTYLNMAYVLRQTAAQLETLRLGAVAMIEGAADVASIEVVLAQFMAAVAQ